MRVHVSQSDDFVAEMAFGRTTAVGDFVWSQTAGEEDVGGFGRRIVWALLRDLEVAELAEDDLCWAECCCVAGEIWEGVCGEGAVGTLSVCVVELVVLGLGREGIAMC